MKNLLVIISIGITGCLSITKVQGQAITDTLQWLKTNIEQKNNCYVGKPLSVLLDTLANRGIYQGKWQYNSPINSDGAPAETTAGDTVYTAHFKIYFGDQKFGVIGQMHRDDPLVNTHLKWVYLTLTKQVPLPSIIVFDRYIGLQFGYVEAICRPYIVKSVTVGEY